MLLTEGFLGWGFFWVWFNVHTFNCHHRADRRVKGWLRRDGWAEGWVGGGMGGLQKLITFFSGWAGLQKLITDLDMKNGYKGGVKGWFH